VILAVLKELEKVHIVYIHPFATNLVVFRCLLSSDRPNTVALVTTLIMIRFLWSWSVKAVKFTEESQFVMTVTV